MLTYIRQIEFIAIQAPFGSCQTNRDGASVFRRYPSAQGNAACG